MAKIFEKNQGPDTDLKRNTFDLSFASHISTKFGQLTPVFCKEVLPGDSFRIDAGFGLRFAPLVFPLQSKIHAAIHFFYVRNRNLYKDWMEYIGKTDDEAVQPYRIIQAGDAKSQIGTGSLGDYLGVPSTIAGEYSNVVSLPLKTTLTASVRGRVPIHDTLGSTDFDRSPIATINRTVPYWYGLGIPTTPSTTADLLAWFVLHPRAFSSSIFHTTQVTDLDAQTVFPYCIPARLPLAHALESTGTITFHGAQTTHVTGDTFKLYVLLHVGDTLDDSVLKTYTTVTMTYNADGKSWTGSLNGIADDINEKLDFNTNNYLVFAFSPSDSKLVCSMPSVSPTSDEFALIGDNVVLSIVDTQVRDATDADALAFNPFVGSSPKIKLNALPFRAYESIYNSFYRNETVDPLVIDGKAVYNDYIRSHEGGADTLLYDLQFRNWEADYFTSCQSSPQQGVAPLVGVSASGEFTFSDGTNTYTAQATVGDDGETITGISTYDESMPKGSLRRLMDTITNGISINDFRNVNALQRWLETNIRKGYKYVDQIRSHFGVSPAFKANDMPEFIGGTHQVVDVSTLSNTSDNLGEYCGQATCLGGNKSSISKFCDEHGFIMGILMVYPEPVYSQMLPKFFTKTNTNFDYFFPEMGHIGLQPITFNEVCPIQVAADDYANSTDTLNDTFGYQRAYADYLASFDEVHGDMRTSLADYVISRTFQDKPELGHNFIAINPDDVNDVFAYTEDDSKIFGQLRFNVSCKRPIPRYGVPRLE